MTYTIFFIIIKVLMETIKDLGKYTFPCLLANSVKKFADRPAVAQV